MPPVCQSCAMPMEFPKDSGTEANGDPSRDYCRECYQGGRFTNPSLTRQDVVLAAAGRMDGMPQSEAIKIAVRAVPGLKRWRFKDRVETFVLLLPARVMLAGAGLFVIGLFLLRFELPWFIWASCVLSGILLFACGWILTAIQQRRMMREVREVLARGGLTPAQIESKFHEHKMVRP